ncbi:MAG: PAS domain-containing sensor histidine kinase [bacterium]|nr:PAS domain-containing sensor histidine kinase [bacterium]
MESTDIYKQYFESMPCYLTVQNRDFKVIDANSRFVNDFGDYSERYCYQVYKQRPEKCEVCPVEKTFRDGRTYQSEEQVKTLDGKDVWVLVNTTPIKNDDGEIVAVMEMSTDITDMKILENQIRESQERYQLIFEEVPCYISIQDKDLRIVRANRMFKESFGTSYGQKCYEVYKHRTEACLPCSVRQTFKDGHIRTHEEVVTDQHNEQKDVLVRTAPIRTADGEIERVIEMSTDITQIRKLQDKLSSIGLLIGSISHTIKGLLNGLDGGIYLVNTGLKKDDSSRINQGWEIALRNIDRIRTMVLNILYYAKERELNYETLNADDFIRDVCSMMEAKAKSINTSFEYDIADNSGEFEADLHSFRSVIVNLLENALDACRTDTKECEHFIKVKLHGNADRVFIEVSDNGIGMDQETKEKAFSLFFSSKGAGGTGLGMFIADKIIQSHGGKITIDSELGKGSTFFVEIPRKRRVKETLKIELA